MSVPKQRRSKQRARTGRAQKGKTSELKLVKCTNCDTMKPLHGACQNCGFYRGKQVLKVERRKARAERKRKRS